MSENESSTDLNLSKLSNSVNDIIFVYLFPILSLFIFITNAICLIVFIKLLKTYNQNGNKMYFYFLVKSICDMIGGLMELLLPLFSANNYIGHYFLAVWYIWCHKYCLFSLLLASAWLNIMGTFDCAISIDNKLKWSQTKQSFLLIVSFIFLFCFILNVYQLFLYGIEEVVVVDSLNSSTIVGYTIKENPFFKSKLHNTMEIIQTLIRDPLIVIILLVINVYILFKIRQVRLRKEKLQISNNSIRIKSMRAENRKIKMISIIFIMYSLLHLPMFIRNSNLIKFSYFYIYLDAFLKVLYYFYYSTFILLNFYFNSQFRNILIQYSSPFNPFRV
jgi:hypothetical protein